MRCDMGVFTFKLTFFCDHDSAKEKMESASISSSLFPSLWFTWESFLDVEQQQSTFVLLEKATHTPTAIVLSPIIFPTHPKKPGGNNCLESAQCCRRPPTKWVKLLEQELASLLPGISSKVNSFSPPSTSKASSPLSSSSSKVSSSSLTLQPSWLPRPGVALSASSAPELSQTSALSANVADSHSAARDVRRVVCTGLMHTTHLLRRKTFTFCQDWVWSIWKSRLWSRDWESRCGGWSLCSDSTFEVSDQPPYLSRPANDLIIFYIIIKIYTSV